jgi:hypothetical protein
VFMLQYRTNAGERRKPALGLFGELTVTRHLVDTAVEVLTAQGHQVMESDLYAMGWKTVCRYCPPSRCTAAYASTPSD